MAELFVNLFNMSVSASWIVLAVIIVRILLKKAPRAVICVLWAFVGFRLTVPFSLESVFSLIPKKTIIPENAFDVSSSVSAGLYGEVSNVVRNPAATSIPIVAVGEASASLNLWKTFISFFSVVWVIGIAVFLLYAFVSWLRLKKRVSEAVCINRNVYICDRIDSPFILGMISPKIYLPSSLSEKDSVHVIAHEKAHLKRLDYLWKPLGFLLLAIYWFNPLMWVAYILLCRDIEFACDENVVKAMSSEGKKSYSEALVNCSISRRFISACPIAFGEVGVKQRITSVLNYKKPAFWVIVISLILCVVIAVCFLTDPKHESKTLAGSNYSVAEVIEGATDNISGYCITADMFLYSVDLDGEYARIGQMEKASIKNSDIKNSVTENIKFPEISDAYSLYYNNEYYAVFKTENGSVYLGKGLSIEETTDLYLLRSELGGGDVDAGFFDRSLNVMGDYVHCFSFFESENIPGYLIVGYVAGESSYTEFLTDMGYAIFTVHEDGYRLIKKYLYPDAALVKGGVFICPDPAVVDVDDKMTDKNTFDVVLSCNSDLSSIVRTVKNGDGDSLKKTVEVDGIRTMTLFRWADDKTTANSSISMKFYGSDGKQIFTTNILPSEDGDLRVVSGRSQSLVYAFDADSSLEEVKSKINWLDLAMDESSSTPFDVYFGNNEIYGFYYLYDAETLEPVDFIRPSGLMPQTYILQNTVRGKSYIVMFRANISHESYEDAIYAFGINVPLAKIETDPFAKSETPYTWLHNITKDNVNAVYGKCGDGEDQFFGVKAIRSLISTLNQIQPHSVYPGKDVKASSTVRIECSKHAYILEYSNGITEISFDKNALSLYPDVHWIIDDAALSSWFESFESEGLSFVGESDLLDISEDIMRKYFSVYSEKEPIPMDLYAYTDIPALAEAMESIHEKHFVSEYDYYSTRQPLVITSASYMEGGSAERIYVEVYSRVLVGGSSFGYSLNLSFKEHGGRYLITDFEYYDAWSYGSGYRYGTFVYQPIDDWEKNGNLYLARIKGESELPSILEVGKDLLNRFAENADNYDEVYTVYDVSFEEYDPGKPPYFFYSQLYSAASSTESKGVILVFDSGRYVACVDSYVIDPRILDGTVTDYYYEDYGVETFGEYFLMNHAYDDRNQYLNAKYIVALD